MLLTMPLVLQPMLVTLIEEASDCCMLTRRLPLYANMLPMQLNCAGRVQDETGT